MNKKSAVGIYKEETGKKWYYEYKQYNGVSVIRETNDYIEWLEEKVEDNYNGKN